ncbi:MAG: 4Fe-4S binding protein [Acidobacteriota bacterium]
MKKWKINLFIALCFLTFTGSPVLIEYLTTPEPVTRNIHIEHFRYGMDPSIIRVNRGDKINFTFSTLDTGHSFFLQDYGIDVKVSPASERVKVYDPFNATEDPYTTESVKITAGLNGTLKQFVSLSRFRCHVYCGKMHGFEQGDLIVRPNWLFSGSIGFIFAFFFSWYIRMRWGELKEPKQLKKIELNKKNGILNKLLKWRPLPFILTVPLIAVFFILILAGLFGTKVGGRNIAVMLTWATWMFALTVLFVPVGARLWCSICPIPSLGEYLQRGATIGVRTEKNDKNRNRYFGFGQKWPDKLKGPWIRIFLFLIIGSFSASLAGQPRWTATVFVILISTAIIMSLIWKNRSFCIYICPVSTFISTYSPIGRINIGARDSSICKDCKEKSCLNGNEKGWACPYGLLVPAINRNMDCGLCGECFKSCNYDNVSVFFRRGEGKGLKLKNYGEVWQILIMMTLAMAYSLTLHSPWSKVRDIVNMVDKADWNSFGMYIFSLWMTALVIIPGIFLLLNKLGKVLTKTDIKKSDLAKRTAPVFIPLGISLWASFFIGMFMPNFTYILMTLSDPFGWGWDLLGTAGKPWIQILPWIIPWLQVIIITTGFIFSLKKGFLIWHSITGVKRDAIKGFLPQSIFVLMITLFMVTYFSYF